MRAAGRSRRWPARACELIGALDPADRAAVLGAIAVTRRARAQLRTTVPDRFRGATRPPRPTLTPLRPIPGSDK